METPKTCASCVNMGHMYHSNGERFDHTCRKGDQRRAEEMPRGADLIDHFRRFFDAGANQPACRHYEERPLSPEPVISLLALIADSNGRGEFKFFSEENALAGKLTDRFVQYHMHATPTHPGSRVYTLLPLGKAELARARSQP